MKSELLRNFGILAHIDAGKTTLSECILYLTGAESRMGAVDIGTAAMDWHSEERERGITISAAVAHCPWRSHRLQFVDTPGHVDFAAEVRRSLQVLDGAIVVIDALEGVQAQTYSVVRSALQHRLPLVFVLNKMDRRCAEFSSACATASKQLGLELVPLQQAFFDGDVFCGVIDLVAMRLLRWNPDDNSTDCWEEEIPDELLGKAQDGHQYLCSKVAENDSKCEDYYLQHSTLSPDLISTGIATATQSGWWYPALASSALYRVGGQPILDAVVDYLPSPVGREIVLHDSETGKDIKLSQSGAETVAYVFKVEKIGSNEIAYVRLFAGDLAAGQDMILERTGDSFVVEDCFTVLADDLQSKATFVCGSLFVIKSSIPLRSGDTLRTTKMRGALEPEQLSSPVVSMTVEASDSALREDLLTKCQWLCCVDPSLLLNLEGGQIVIQGQGQLHLQIAANHLRKRCDYPLRFGRVMVENYESVSVTIEHQTSYAHFDSPDSALLMSLECVPSTEHGIRLKYSPLLSGFAHSFLQSLYSADTFVGWVGPQGLPIRGLELTIKRLEWSEGVDACPDLLIAALHQCLTEVIELKGVTQRPYLNFEVRIPESELAAVLADLQQRNAEISAVEHQEGRAVVFAGAFLEHLSDYSNELRSQSHGLAELAFGAQSWRS